MERAALFLFLLPLLALACSSGRPGMSPDAKPAAAEPAKAAEPSVPAAPAACDYKVVAMSDPAQKQIQCANGESFVVRRGNDGQWYEEMKVRAGTRPGYATPDEAAKARCCGHAE